MARNYYAFHKYMTLIKSLFNFVTAKLYITAKTIKYLTKNNK